MTGPTEGTRLAGAVVLVTGATSGIGRALVPRLVAADARVVASGRDTDRLAELADTCAGVFAADLAAPGAGRQLAERVLDRWGRVDALVCAAGVGWAGEFSAMPDARVDALVQVNLRAPIEATRVLLPGMLAHGGHLVYVTSIAGRLGVAEEAVYAATKAGLDTFAESLRLELTGAGVRVSVVVPGVVDTPFFARRGRPYQRRRPRPVPADRVARALTSALAGERPEVYVPGWLRLPVAVRALVPALYRRLAGRFGGP
ncbi:SDR family NAD(P)-dependent oxidoreductase [Phytohabitans kaempferiae]|uniref:SDR family NAD(P)-dependent oxidoreductase n=1 Tax=Phytohabitans kaempferiae TaxID=1620943 RepID=A0ABV6M5C0_9ACTN